MAQDSPIAYRLREALRLRGRTPNWLQVQLTRQGVPGSSSASVSRYVNGTVTPPLEFLQAAARMLGVFEPWLISGYGTPEEAPDEAARHDPESRRLEQLADSTRALVGAWEEDERNVEYRIADRFYRFRGLREIDRRLVLEVFERAGEYTDEHRYSVVPWDRFQTRHGHDLQLAHDLGALLQAPLDVLGLDRPEAPYELSDDQLHQYIMGMVQAISALLPPRREPSDEELAEQRRWSDQRREQAKRWAEEPIEITTPKRLRRTGPKP